MFPRLGHHHDDQVCAKLLHRLLPKGKKEKKSSSKKDLSSPNVVPGVFAVCWGFSKHVCKLRELTKIEPAERGPAIR